MRITLSFETLVFQLSMVILLDYDIYVADDKYISSPTGARSKVSIDATSSSSIGERLTLTDADEDLIIVLSGTRTKKYPKL